MDMTTIVTDAEKLISFLIKHIEQSDKVNKAVALLNKVPQDGTPQAQLAKQVLDLLA